MFIEIAKRQEAIRVRKCKDDYLGWITATAVSELTPHEPDLLKHPF